MLKILAFFWWCGLKLKIMTFYVKRWWCLEKIDNLDVFC